LFGSRKKKKTSASRCNSYIPHYHEHHADGRPLSYQLRAEILVRSTNQHNLGVQADDLDRSCAGAHSFGLGATTSFSQGWYARDRTSGPMGPIFIFDRRRHLDSGWPTSCLAASSNYRQFVPNRGWTSRSCMAARTDRIYVAHDEFEK
jgi:hypothetical protein